MSEPFFEKLGFVLKVLSVSRARLAAEIGVDKSVVGRWVTGVTTPSAHNLAQLNAMLAKRIAGFTALAWDGELAQLAAMLGVQARGAAPAEARGLRAGLRLPFVEQIIATTELRGGAYEGFYRSTRPYASNPGLFLHDQVMLRLDGEGVLRLKMGTGGVHVEGWVLLLGHLLFVIGSEFTSGSLVFGLFNGVNTVKAQTLDGLTLTPLLDAGRTPTASASVLHRTGDLTGDVKADDARFESLAAEDPLAPQGSVPEALRSHLVRDIGPAQLALGGDWLLRMPLARSWSAGPPLP
jgi:transcriptional regulator with XRE-family HTH domain